MCNLAGSFVSSMPVTGSFSRTAVNSSSGVKTTFGGVFTGALVILALAVLVPACAYIPKATLSAVIISAVIFMVEHHVVKPLWKASSKPTVCVYNSFLLRNESQIFCYIFSELDLAIGLLSFFFCAFWELEMGILIGAACQIFHVLYNTARPSVVITTEQVYIFLS